MLKFFWNALRRAGPTKDLRQDPSWRSDPLAHPVIERMTMNELADLPLGRVRYDCNQGR